MGVGTLTNGTKGFKYNHYDMANTKTAELYRNLLKTIIKFNFASKAWEHQIPPEEAHKYFIIRKIEEELDVYDREESKVFE